MKVPVRADDLMDPVDDRGTVRVHVGLMDIPFAIDE
jgi:hypothetical protein